MIIDYLYLKREGVHLLATNKWQGMIWEWIYHEREGLWGHGCGSPFLEKEDFYKYPKCLRCGGKLNKLELFQLALEHGVKL